MRKVTEMVRSHWYKSTITNPVLFIIGYLIILILSFLLEEFVMQTQDVVEGLHNFWEFL